MRQVQSLVESHADLQDLFEHPRLDRFEKLGALQNLLKNPLSQTMANFLLLLMTKKRMKYFQAVADHFERLCYESQGKAIARVLTAAPLSAGEKTTLSQRLTQTFGLDVEIREQVKPDLIGGVIVYLGDQRLDASLLGQLAKMKQRLLRIDI
jgi:F-type H+-transporting ATPase subunit delta